METTVCEKPVDCSKQSSITFLCGVIRQLPKSTNLGELVVVANMFWYVISFLLMCSICCVGFVANAVEATGDAKISEQDFCYCSVNFVVHSTLKHFPRFYGQALAQELLLYLTMSLTSLLYNGLYTLGLGLLLLIFLSSCFLNCARRAALCQTIFHR